MTGNMCSTRREAEEEWASTLNASALARRHRTATKEELERATAMGGVHVN